ncbi:hypothetical protein MCUN1_002183 [Malassezia cuniculi]|uniref:Uncharacterized protein n=1 Tax=Malassezia cuniculi TaxID=948313 RepID=A0AAF0EZ20_9BASI|nr:hypothetical protein MCUN1_002183 [Malassezia cuniculi]
MGSRPGGATAPIEGSSRSGSRPQFRNCDAASNTATAPFLTNVESHFGRVTLTAPDNIRRTRRDRAAAARRSPQPVATNLLGDAGVIRRAASAQTLPRTGVPLARMAQEAPAYSTSASTAHVTRPPHNNAARYVTTTQRDGIQYAGRHNMWDAIPNVEEEADPPPAFAEDRTPAAPNVQPRVPNSPPPAYVAEEPEQQDGDDDNGDDTNNESEAEDEFMRQERAAWEADRMAGMSVHVRVARSNQRRAAYERRQLALPEVPVESEQASAQAASDAQPPTDARSADGQPPTSVPAPGEQPPNAHASTNVQPRTDSRPPTTAPTPTISHATQPPANAPINISANVPSHAPVHTPAVELSDDSSVDEQIRPLPQWERRPRREDSDSDESLFADSDEEQAAPAEAATATATAASASAAASASTSMSASGELPGRRPLPQPPTSRAGVLSAREQLQDADVIRQLGLALERPNPLTPSQITRANTIRGIALQRGASVRAARSSAAPPPRQLHLPAVTEATRHFPPTDPVRSASMSSNDSAGLSRRESIIAAVPPIPDAEPYPNAQQQRPANETAEITDLELATALLDDPNYRFESAALLTEFLGPATPGALLTERERSDIPVGRVEQNASSRSVVGVNVDNCGICLSEFLPGEMAVLAAEQPAVSPVPSGHWQ